MYSLHIFKSNGIGIQAYLGLALLLLCYYFPAKIFLPCVIWYFLVQWYKVIYECFATIYKDSSKSISQTNLDLTCLICNITLNNLLRSNIC